MAYVLGYFVADGCMIINPRGSHYISFTSTDSELLYKVRKLMSSKHKIGFRKSKNPNWKDRYNLQIGSKEIFQDLLNLNLTPNKSKTIKLPKVPKKYFKHFIRGYFDGDGCISFNKYRRTNRNGFSYGLYAIFTCGNHKFLKDILKLIKKYVKVNRGKIQTKSKNTGFELRFTDKDSVFKLYEFMYENVSDSQFLKRKYYIFQKVLTHWGA